ncbi:hypothetical protein D1AOALGA4SA_10437 [Olavius algarvensis Delta 1 endosymbiont]|nr:hypothetical protein D1AOALGA4SA_10437 [Olavius algarvensis Delta 1 endosymbiont]
MPISQILVIFRFATHICKIFIEKKLKFRFHYQMESTVKSKIRNLPFKDYPTRNFQKFCLCRQYQQ